MKKLMLVLVLAMIGFSAHAQKADKINWLTFEEAAAMTEKDPKMIIVDVYTDWCGWCKKMDKGTFTDPTVVEYIN
ncbi:MAG TPA: DUF255 domain-containing protein, partial [Anditalea sp.]|nr:DUF255 domain-containing protein [Anditalea sp.]